MTIALAMSGVSGSTDRGWREGVKVRVDPERCQGHTLCAMIAPEMFRLSEIDGCSSAVCEVVPADEEHLVREAAQSCPEQAILVEKTPRRPPTAGVDHEIVREPTP